MVGSNEQEIYYRDSLLTWVGRPSLKFYEDRVFYVPTFFEVIRPFLEALRGLPRRINAGFAGFLWHFTPVERRWECSHSFPTFSDRRGADGTSGCRAGENARDWVSCRCGDVGTSARGNTPIRHALFRARSERKLAHSSLTLGMSRCGDVPRSAHDLFPNSAALCVQEREHLIERLAALGLNRRRIEPGEDGR